ncbi:MAG: PH domain-containing protein [Thermoproteota archaeon]|nr:PH domain-containing protein [Thermoproteota archaeon]
MAYLRNMPFRFGKENESEVHLVTDNITDKDDLEEIRKIANRLGQDEKVRFVAKQSRMKPGGSALATPNIVFATDRRIIIRNPTMLGMRENIEDIPYDKITSVKLEKGIFSSTILIRAPGLSEMSRVSKHSGLIAWGRGEDGQIDALPRDKGERLFTIIREGIDGAKKVVAAAQSSGTIVKQQQISIADELTKLATLKQQGIISEIEFTQMKQDLLKKIQG